MPVIAKLRKQNSSSCSMLISVFPLTALSRCNEREYSMFIATICYKKEDLCYCFY